MNAEISVERKCGDRGSPPVLLLGYARLSNLIEIAKIVLPSKPCCFFIQIDGGSFDKRSKDIEELQTTIKHLAGSSTRIEIAVAPRNLGIAKNLTLGMTRVFAQHDSVVVLEDDCFPSRLFYEFMSLGLCAHETNQRVGMITGNAFIHYPKGEVFCEVSSSPLTWGWATWRDRWKDFDSGLSGFSPDDMFAAIKRHARSPLIRKHWRHRIQESLADPNMWDAQWTVFMWIKDYLCINPSVNMVSNRGVDDKATHTLESSIFTQWATPQEFQLSEETERTMASPLPWTKLRSIRHRTLYRFDNLRSVLAKLGLPMSPKLIREISMAIATSSRRR